MQTETLLPECDVIHKGQIKKMFESKHKEGHMKIKGGKAGTGQTVWSVLDIQKRAVLKRAGQPIRADKNNAPAFVRSTSREIQSPRVPVFEDGAHSMSPASASAAQVEQSGATSPCTTLGALSQANIDRLRQSLGQARSPREPSPQLDDRVSAGSPAVIGVPEATQQEDDTGSIIADSVAMSEALPPKYLSEDAKWEWKLKQLSYSSALDGPRKWGRERRTCGAYAVEADTKGKHLVAAALRQRAKIHDQLENLRLGGWATMEFSQLKSECEDHEPKLGDAGWGKRSEKEIVKR